MTKDRFGKPGGVSLSYYKKHKCKSAQIISIRIVSLSKICNLRNNNLNFFLCKKFMNDKTQNYTLFLISYAKDNIYHITYYYKQSTKLLEMSVNHPTCCWQCDCISGYQQLHQSHQYWCLARRLLCLLQIGMRWNWCIYCCQRERLWLSGGCGVFIW